MLYDTIETSYLPDKHLFNILGINLHVLVHSPPPPPPSQPLKTHNPTVSDFVYPMQKDPTK